MNTFSIRDIDGFSHTIRDGAAKSISENYTENLDEFISIGQIKKLIHDSAIKRDDSGSPLITEKIFDDLFEYIRNNIYQVGLAKLAAKGSIECAWDNNINSMVFWLNSVTEGTLKINPIPDHLS